MKVEYLEVRGFRSYGASPQRLNLAGSLSVVHADNGQGKSSLAEAVEFLLPGATSRRLYEAGLSTRVIAERLGLGASTITRGAG